jgi:hypothetical protein
VGILGLSNDLKEKTDVSVLWWDSRSRERESGRLEAGEEGKVLDEALRLFALLHQQKYWKCAITRRRGYKATNDRL